MATAQIENTLPTFPPSTTVKAYGGVTGDGGWPKPQGAVLDTGVVGEGGFLEFDSLPEINTDYVAAAEIGGEWKFIQFTSEGLEGEAGLAELQEALEEHIGDQIGVHGIADTSELITKQLLDEALEELGSGSGDVVLNIIEGNLSAPRIEGSKNIWVATGTPVNAIKGTDLVITESPLQIADIEGLETVLEEIESAGGLSEAKVKELIGAEAQPKDADLTAIAALTTNATGRELLTKATVASIRTYLELGTAALEASTAFQPKDTDLTEIAALTTTSSGRSLLAKTISTIGIELIEQTTAALMREKMGLGTMAVKTATEYQPVDSDLTAIAELTTTSSGRSLLAKTISTLAIELLEQTTAANMRTKLGLGTIAVKAEGDYVASTLPAAKGDIFAASANDTPAILTVGSNGQVLSAQSGEAQGLKWITNVQYDTKTVFVPAPEASKVLGGFVVRLPTGVTGKLIQIIAKTTSGTAKYKVKRITELGAGSTTEPTKEKEATSTAAKVTPTETLANEDLILIETEGTVSSPVGLLIECVLEYTR